MTSEAATIGYIHRNIEIYIGQPNLQAAKTTRGPHVVRALREELAPLWEELKGKCVAQK